MKILCILHAIFEKLGSIETWAKKNNHFIQEVNPHRGEILPDMKEFDFLIVMGGPQSILELDSIPYLKNEIELIKQAIKNQKRILGVCLGAQLIGEALGARAERSPHPEIGMYPVELLDAAKEDPVFRHFPSKFGVMHWHNDMPGIPNGAVLLAKSGGCPRQAFKFGDRIYGFQCHFEFTDELIKILVENCSSDLVNHGDFVMTVKDLLRIDCSEINLQLEKVLNYLGSLSESSSNSIAIADHSLL